MPDKTLFHIAVSALIVAISLILYLPTKDFEMVWDDHELLINEPMASGQQHWTSPFSEPVDRLYRPLRTISFNFTQKYTDVPSGHHIINVILFVFTVISAYWFLFMLTGNRFIASTASILYLLHPINAEVVPWITGGRANLMASPLIFTCLALYLIGRKYNTASSRFPMLFLSAISFVAALFSKESSLIVPIAVSVIELTFPRDIKSGTPSRIMKMLMFSLPYYVLALIFFLIRTEVLKGTGQVIQYHGGSLSSTIISMIPVITDYLRMIILPVNLCAEYNPEIFPSLFNPAPLVSLLALVSILTTGFFTIRRFPLFSFSVLWFFIWIIPASNIIPIAAMKSNRFLTESSLSGCILIATIIYSMMKYGRRNRFCMFASVFIAISITACFIVNTINYRDVWKNNMTLWTATVVCAPDSEKAYNNLGIECFRKGRIPEATKAFENARDLNPGFVAIRENLGQLYALQGRYEEALAEFNAVYFYNPSPDVMLKISLIFRKLGNRRMAIFWLERAIDRDEVPENMKHSLRKELMHLKKREQQ